MTTDPWLDIEKELMTTDPWLHILEQLEPNYYSYKDSLEQNSRFEIKLSDFESEHCYICIQQINDHNFGPVRCTNEFKEKYMWTAKQLVSWPNCYQICDINSKWQWHFKYRKDAEKFKTLFTLKWAQ